MNGISETMRLVFAVVGCVLFLALILLFAAEGQINHCLERIRRLIGKSLPKPPEEKKLWQISEDGEVSFFEDEPQPLPAPDFLAVAGALKTALEHPETVRLPFGLNASGSAGVHVVPADAMPSGPVWFLGDVHGDYPALLASCEYILERDRDAVLCFCGDLVDRGPDSLNVVLRVLDMMLRAMPGRVLWIRGNHEDALKYREEPGRFASSVKPAGFTEFLNGHAEYAGFGRDLLRFIRLLPSAVFLPDGLLFTHAGIPMDDLLPKLASVQDLSLPKMLSDFCWIRIEPDQEFKKVSRFSKGSTAGRVNIENFFLKCEELGIRANRIVAGHQHPREGFTEFDGLTEMESSRYPRCKCLQSVLILHNSAIAEFGEEDAQPFAVARYRENEQPEVKVLHFRPDVFDSLYKKTGSRQETTGAPPETNEA